VVFHGLSRAIQRAPSVQQALEHAAASAVFSLPEGLNAPLLAALLDERIRAIPAGRTHNPVALRADLARENGAVATCPTSTAIFLRIVAERALERLGDDPTPFWRVIAPDSLLARKLSCGPDFIRHRRALEA
jgi:hypothetical protein